MTAVSAWAFDNTPESIEIMSGSYYYSGDSYCYCLELKNISVSEDNKMYSLEGVDNVGFSVFSGCRSLTSITLPKSLMQIGKNAFWGNGTIEVL